MGSSGMVRRQGLEPRTRGLRRPRQRAFYGTYPGMYIPTPLPFRLVDMGSSPEHLAEELLALTKMNWNQTQLDGRLPIALRTADRVGEILRHLGHHDRPQGWYAFYM